MRVREEGEEKGDQNGKKKNKIERVRKKRGGE